MTYIPDWTELPGPYDMPRRKRKMTVDEQLDEIYFEPEQEDHHDNS